MPKMTLTEEEKRHIEQRRENKKQFSIGYNSALAEVLTLLQEKNLLNDINLFIECINFLRKEIK